MEPNNDLDWARLKWRWVLSRIASRLEQEAQLHRRVARELRGRK